MTIIGRFTGRIWPDDFTAAGAAIPSLDEFVRVEQIVGERSAGGPLANARRLTPPESVPEKRGRGRPKGVRKNDNASRDELVLRRRRSGESVRNIAQSLSLTPQRVHQIIGKQKPRAA